MLPSFRHISRRLLFAGISILIAVEVIILVRPGRLFLSPLCRQTVTKDRNACVTETVRKALRGQGAGSALFFLANSYASDPSVADVCHSLTHEIGAFAYQQQQKGKQVSASKDFAICSYGFYHGFMEQLAGEGDMDAARKFCARVDKELGAVTPDARLQCYHGIGHGTVNNHDPRTWGNEQAMIEPALALCAQVAQTQEDRSRCATGVYNGIATFYNEGLYKLHVRADDPLWICRKQQKEYQEACYISLNITLLQLTNGDIAAAAKFLEPITDDTTATHAMINLAAPVGSKNITTDDHSGAIAACRSVQQRLQLSCIAGYAFGMLEHGVPGKEYEKPLEFCGSKALVPSEREGCFEYIISYLPQWYGKNMILRICDTLNEQFRPRCAKVVQQ